jgi:hypothetical protein
MNNKRYGPQQVVLSSSIGDIFWDLGPYVVYIPGSTMGATVYVANPSTSDREYSLIIRLYDADGQLISEEAHVVYGYAWFEVKAGQYVKIHSEFGFNYSDKIMNVVLVDRTTGDEIDNVTTYLVMPQASAIIPGGSTITNWDSIMSIIMMIMTLGVVSSMITGGEDAEGAESAAIGG